MWPHRLLRPALARRICDRHGSRFLRRQECRNSPPPFRILRTVRVRCWVAPNVLGLALAALAGCGSGQSRQANSPNRGAVVAPKPPEVLADQRFDFGAIVDREARKLTHQYFIKNNTSRPIKLLRSVNGKPCCGDVESLKPTTLGPQQTATLKVSLRVGGTIGPVQHFASVETDVREKKVIHLSTTANVYAQARILETDEAFQAPVPGRFGRRAFTVSTYGTEREPPVALDNTVLNATTAFLWSGPATDAFSTAGSWSEPARSR